MKSSAPARRHRRMTPDKPFVAVDGHLRLLARRAARHPEAARASTSARRSSRRRSARLNVDAYLYRGYWADVGTIEAFYDANIQLTQRGAPFNFFHPHRPIYTHPRFLPATRTYDTRIDTSIIAEGCFLDTCEIRDSVVGIRTARRVRRADHALGAARRGLLPGRGCGYGEVELGIGRTSSSIA
jgi:hypothetical protein